MRRLAVAMLLLSACAKQEPADNRVIDISAAADRAKDDIATYAANTAEPGPAEAASPNGASGPHQADAPLTPPAPGTPGGLPDDRTPVVEGRFAPDSPQAAAGVVQRYYAAIESGRYRDAWALWDHGGKDSGMTVAAFVASFGKYKEYHADIGAPGDVDAGAGQRYVTVPVQIRARLADGRADYRLGTVTLHRVGDIDGATAEQRQWHIRSIDLKPAPGGAATPRPSGRDLRGTGGPGAVAPSGPQAPGS